MTAGRPSVWADVVALAQLSLREPRAAGRVLGGLDLSRGTIATALALVAVLSALSLHATLALLPEADRAALERAVGTPWQNAALQAGAIALCAALIHLIGRAAGGKGRYLGALLAVIWVQFLLLPVQILQIVGVLGLPVVAEIAGIVGVGLFFWILSGLIAEQHRFVSQGRVALVMVGLLVAIGLLFSTALMPAAVPGA
jgi:hypothetical protein